MQKPFWRIFRHSVDFLKERVKSLFFVFQFFQNRHTIRKRRTMRTPSEFAKNLKSRCISMEMLDAALYSVNKRAKNWRNKKREYKHNRYDYYGNYEKAEINENLMYKKKEKLLSIFPPTCIHKEFFGYERIRVYDYQRHYTKLLTEHALKGDIVWINSYWDYDRDNEVNFFDYEIQDEPIYHYYLFHEMPKHTYHTPIDESDIKKYDLPVIEIDTIRTDGDDISDLVSVQFVDKLIALIESKDFTFEYIRPEQSGTEDKSPASAPASVQVSKPESSKMELSADPEAESNFRYFWNQINDYVLTPTVEKIKKEVTIKPYQLTEKDKEDINNRIRPKVEKLVTKNKKLKKLHIQKYNQVLNGTYYNLPYRNGLYENIIKEYNQTKDIRLACDNGTYPIYRDYIAQLLNTDEVAKTKNQYIQKAAEKMFRELSKN